ncbi:MAG TPA: hypothetical protein ENN55_01955 [Firmicutes bacterium]|nr:hypothetical protein [Bacillota bacterium]
MAEIDVDSILAKKEAEEKRKSMMKKLKIYGIAAGAAVLAGIIVFFAVVKFMGEKSAKYFPATGEFKMFYNKTGTNPERWEFSRELVDVNGRMCAVINKVNTGTNRTKQDYFYSNREQGIVRYAYSNNFGEKKVSPFVYLPYRVKKGASFTAAEVRGVSIKASVDEFEVMMSAAGEFETMRVEYKGAPYYNKTMWYAEGVGVIRERDNLKGNEMNLISVME